MIPIRIIEMHEVRQDQAVLNNPLNLVTDEGLHSTECHIMYRFPYYCESLPITII